jgi:glycerate kinase
VRILAAPDKFKGSIDAAGVAAAIATGATGYGRVRQQPVADGGEGTLQALGGANRVTLVSGPLGDAVEARWRLAKDVAVIEMAEAAGLTLVGGADENDALTAATTGVGELICEAASAGARRIIVGVGGSASTDGGLGAIRAMEPLARLRGVSIEVACDVRITFCDAAKVFGPQKGASSAEIAFLTRRLGRLAEIYVEEFGVDVTELVSSGAAGGLAGGLAAVGATLLEGFELIAEELGLADAIEEADLVITGEGCLDDQSFHGKAVGGVVELAEEFGVPVLIVAGQVADVADDLKDRGVTVVSISDVCGIDAAFADPAGCIATVVEDHLSQLQ